MQMCGRHNSCRAGKSTFILLLLININSLFIKVNIILNYWSTFAPVAVNRFLNFKILKSLP